MPEIFRWNYKNNIRFSVYCTFTYIRWTKCTLSQICAFYYFYYFFLACVHLNSTHHNSSLIGQFIQGFKKYSTRLDANAVCIVYCIFIYTSVMLVEHTTVTNIYYDRQTQQCLLLTCYFINYRMSLWLHVLVIVWPSSGLQELSCTCSYCASMFYRET